jgi:xanthine dehydrogenase accessory factor
MHEILDEASELLEGGLDFALVTLAAERGSTPREAGAEMLVRRDGSIAGTIGGGLLEHEMMQEATRALDERRSRRTRVDLGGTDVRGHEKMLCGGEADVLVTYVAPGDEQLLAACRALRAALAAGRTAWYLTVLPAEEGAAVDHCCVDDEGIAGASWSDPLELRAAVDSVRSTVELAGGRRALVERLDPPATVLICGAGHVGLALAPAARAVGFRVVVIDDRADFATAARFPAAELVVTPFPGALARVGVSDRTFVVIVTRGHAHDMDVLEQALRTPAHYVGLMASRSKRERMIAALREGGFDDGDIARLHSPIGLDIGAETPAELAASIVAELIHVRAHGDV